MKEKTTLEELARMTANGFSSMERRFDEVATKLELKEVKEELQTELQTVKAELQTELQTVKTELQKDIAVVQRLPESVGRRLDRVEDDVRLVKTKVGMR
ncbi:MAG: hypothetical protein Q7R93_01515 [bacterium]|nr:hypothetical protein [bacterium]